jgi:hypothetical protein
MRVTRLDSCGRPIYGDCSQIVSEGFVSIAATANIDDGEEITVTNANGKKCVNQPACPSLTNIGLEITFCDVDPVLYATLTGNEVVYDNNGDAVGFRVSTAVSPCDVAFALEVWSNVPGVACSDDPNAEGTFGYLLYSYVQGGILGDYTIENAAVSFVITGAQTKDGTPWGEGPYDVVLGSGATPAPLLVPLGQKDHFHVQLTEVAPPEAACGCIPLDDPNGAPATTADAGTPGTWGPAPAIRPYSFDDLVAAQPPVVGNPSTVWTEGQYVVLGDGTEAYWNGTAWAEGDAPVIVAGTDTAPEADDDGDEESTATAKKAAAKKASAK